MRRLPSEWEEHEAVLLAWPHDKSDWLPHLASVEPVFVEISRQISRFERVVIVARNPAAVYGKLESAGTAMGRVTICQMETNDTWARDFGPITILENNQPVMLDFEFNGWGLKFPAQLDNEVNGRLSSQGLLGNTPLRKVGMVLEGGSIESDGDGTLLTTSRCLLSPNRNPKLTQKDIEEILGEALGVQRFLWLKNGSLEGDDTDSHIDTLARFGPSNTILHVSCHDSADEHYDTINAMVEELKLFRTNAGEPYRLAPLPWPSPCFDANGLRLPATYANFLVINGAVLVPTYRNELDRVALEVVGWVFRGREIVPIDCLPLLVEHGSLHCLTMQLPRGSLP